MARSAQRINRLTIQRLRLELERSQDVCKRLADSKTVDAAAAQARWNNQRLEYDRLLEMRNATIARMIDELNWFRNSMVSTLHVATKRA